VSERRACLGALGAGVLLGVPVAFVAVLFLLILHEATDAVWHDLPDAAWTGLRGLVGGERWAPPR
jgi:hypothetical protein